MIPANQNQETFNTYPAQALSWMRDGNGGWIPTPSVLTEEEAILYLRLDKQKANPKKTLQYYREKKILKAAKIGNNLLYSRVALDKFVEIMSS